ncbi:MAG: hypothetical protein ACFCU8_07715 [Thermosynechococcaceae cyanobacterium]
MFFSTSRIHTLGPSISTSFIKGALLLSLLGAGFGLQSVSAQPEQSHAAQSNVAVSVTSLADGVYLYGKKPEAGQAQTEYFVFKLQNKRVVGAFYMPQSSYDCFRGDLNASQLNLTVMTSYEEQAYDHKVSLTAYHPITQVSDNDLQMVQTCQTDASLLALDK